MSELPACIQGSLAGLDRGPVPGLPRQYLKDHVPSAQIRCRMGRVEETAHAL